ncbi:MAG: hypothetical protein Tsb0020_10570 [Haliangiales bacterium]
MKDDELMSAIGAGVRRARYALELTQQSVADRVGLSVQFYGRIERGTALPSVEALKRLTVALNVSADELLSLPIRSSQDGDPEYAADVQAYLELDRLSLRRLMRRLRAASPKTLRLVKLLLRELERTLRATRLDK